MYKIQIAHIMKKVLLLIQILLCSYVASAQTPNPFTNVYTYDGQHRIGYYVSFNYSGYNSVAYFLELSEDQNFANILYSESGQIPLNGSDQTVYGWIESNETNLKYGTQYYIRVRVDGTFSCGSACVTTLSSDWVYRDIKTNPSRPNLNNPTNVTISSFSLSWSPVSGSTYYLVDIATNSSFSNPLVNKENVITNSFNFSSAQPGLYYYYRVTAGNEDGLSQTSFYRNFVTPTIAPQNFESSNVGIFNALTTWQVPPSTQFIYLELSKNEDFSSTEGSHTLGWNITNYQFDGLEPNTQYFCRIRTRNSSNYYSDYSYSTFKTNALPSIVVSNFNLTLPPSPSSTASNPATFDLTVANLTGDVTLSANNGFELSVGGQAYNGTLSLPISTYGTDYTQTVSVRTSSLACSNANLSGTLTITSPNADPVSVDLSGDTSGDTPLTTTVSLEVVSSTSIRATWAEEASATAKVYELWRSTDQECGQYSLIASVPATPQMSFTDNGLSAGTSYFYKVRYINYPDPTTVGIIGEATPGGWSADTDMTEDSPGLWKVTLNLSQGVAKFRANDAWEINWGGQHAIVPTFPTGNANFYGQDIGVTQEGLYEVVLNLNNFTYNFNYLGPLALSSIGIIGSATANGDASGWNQDIDMTQDPNNPYQWEITISLSAHEIKFRANDSWDINWGDGTPEDPTVDGIGDQVGSSFNISVPATGTYLVRFNTFTREYSLTAQ